MSTTAEDHLPPYRVRPRFLMQMELTPAEIQERIAAHLLRDDAPCRGSIHEHHGTLFPPHEDQHYWSPQLSISMDREETDEMTTFRGLYGPRPSVWTLFVFIYSVIGFGVLVISIVGFTNLNLGQSARILWLLPVLVLIFCSLYLVSFFGQRLGHDQMVTLHSFLESALEREIR